MLRGWQPILTAQSQKRPDREWPERFGVYVWSSLVE